MSPKKFRRIFVVSGRTKVTHHVAQTTFVMGEVKTRSTFPWSTSMDDLNGHVVPSKIISRMESHLNVRDLIYFKLAQPTFSDSKSWDFYPESARIFEDDTTISEICPKTSEDLRTRQKISEGVPNNCPQCLPFKTQRFRKKVSSFASFVLHGLFVSRIGLGLRVFEKCVS